MRSLASVFPFLRRYSNTNQDAYSNTYSNNHHHSKRKDSDQDTQYDLPEFTWADGSPVNKEAFHSASLASEKLLHYLTKNNSLEYPRDTQTFKITLQPNVELSETANNVYTIDESGELVPHPDFINSNGNSEDGKGDKKDNSIKVFKGIAYRQVVSLNPSTGYPVTSFKRVGWARFVVTRDGPNPQVEGTWKVDDEEGLGVPAAIYKINTKAMFEALLSSSFSPSPTPSMMQQEQLIANQEWHLLRQVEEQYGYEKTQMVVWRDADADSTMYQNLDLLQDDYDWSGVSKVQDWLKKRSDTSNTIDFFNASNPFSGFDNDDPDALFKYQQTHFPKLMPRSGDTNDTGGSGYSSGLNLASTVGDSSGCPKRRVIALMGIAADCGFVSSFNSSSATREWIVEMVNSASQIYEKQLNVTLGISALVLVNETSCPSSSQSSSATPWSYSCESNPSTAMNDRLGLFSAWRGKRNSDEIAAWTLLTTCAQSSVVGLSWMGLLCNPGSSDSSVAGTNVVARTPFNWRVYAHEVGHTFGAVHDCTSDTCSQNLQSSSQCCVLSKNSCSAEGAYIMNPASGSGQAQFSACTVGNICAAIGRNTINSTCLTSNTGVKLVTANECGNGIVEEGEDCDCGGPEGCANNTCCDPTTCKFKPGAQCDDSNEECCSGCKFASTSTVCRDSSGPCDYTINCPGNSSVCPPARFRPDGESCSLDNSTFKGLKCTSGHCTSRDLQCVQLLGNTTLLLNGNIVNVTRSCSDDSRCQLSCVDPSYGDMCITTSQNFLDGTPCRGSGTCRMGRCIGGDSLGGGFFGGLPSWASRNTGTLIAIIVSIGGFIFLLVLVSVLKRMWWSHRNRKIAAANQQQFPKPQGPYNVPPPYPQAGVYSQRATHPPPPPPPVHTQNQSQWQGYGNDYGNSSYGNSNYGNNSYNNNYGNSNNNSYGNSYNPSDYGAHSYGGNSNTYYPNSQAPPPPSGPPQSYEMSTLGDSSRSSRPAISDYSNPFINPSNNGYFPRQ